MVRHIIIEVGPLSGVEPELLARAFSIARAGGCASRAQLSIEPTLIRVECMTCGASTRAAVNRLLCGGCGGYRTRVVAGDELRLRRVELSMEPRTASADVRELQARSE